MEDSFSQTGILGMKWGIRRYQNKDGSLTEAGRKRYTNGDSPDSGSGSGSGAKKKASEMSDDELKSAIDRLRLEKQYTDMKKDLTPEKEKTVRNFIGKALKDFSSSLMSKFINSASDSIIKKIFEKDDDEPMNPEVLSKIKNTLGPEFKDVDEGELRKVVSMAKNLKMFKSFLNNDSSGGKDDSGDD